MPCFPFKRILIYKSAKSKQNLCVFCTLPIHFEEHRTFIIIEEDNKNMGRKGEVFVAAKFFHPL